MSMTRFRLVSLNNPNEVIECATELDDDYIAALHHPILQSHIVVRADGKLEARRVLDVFRAEFDITKMTQAQQQRATRPRVKIGDQAEPLHQIIRRLVGKPELRALKAKSIWPHFFAELRSIGCDPVEAADESKITYDFGVGRRQMTFKTFRNLVAEIRREDEAR